MHAWISSEPSLWVAGAEAANACERWIRRIWQLGTAGRQLSQACFIPLCSWPDTPGQGGCSCKRVMSWPCRCNELMSNLDFATLPMFELKFEWFTEEGQANWMDPLVEWMGATGLDPEGGPLMIKPATGYAGVGVQPVRGALAVGHAAMQLFATVSFFTCHTMYGAVAANSCTLAPSGQAVMPTSCLNQ